MTDMVLCCIYTIFFLILIFKLLSIGNCIRNPAFGLLAHAFAVCSSDPSFRHMSMHAGMPVHMSEIRMLSS